MLTNPSRFGLAAAVLASALFAPVASATECATAACGYEKCRAGAVAATPLATDLFEPLDVGLLPSTRDVSTWAQNTNFHDGSHPFTTDLDIEGNHIFVADNSGMQIWQHNGTSNFPRLSRVYLGASGGTGARWCGTPELKHPIQWVDVLDGDSNVAALGAGQCELGLFVFDTTSKNSPALKYQADGYDMAGVWTTKVGSAEYAVAAGRSNGARVYNLAAARNLPSLCRDDTVGSTGCGVYLRQLGTMTNTTGVHGVGKYVVISGPRVEIFDVTSTSGTPLVSFDPGNTSGFNFGVSLLMAGGSTYLTALYFPTSGTNMEMGLWNVTSCLSTGCTSPGPALDTETISGLNLPRYLSTSFRAGKPYLYVGTEFTCTRDEADWLFEITGSGNAARLSRVDTRVGYWEWYYGASNVNGTFDARPRRAKFLGDHLYRAMWSFFDVHRFRGGPSTEPPSGGTGGSGQGGEGAAGGSGGSGWSGSGGVVAASGAGGEGANAAEPQADPDVDSSCATVGSSPTGSVPWWFALGLVALVLRSRRSS